MLTSCNNSAQAGRAGPHASTLYPIRCSPACSACGQNLGELRTRTSAKSASVNLAYQGLTTKCSLNRRIGNMRGRTPVQPDINAESCHQKWHPEAPNDERCASRRHLRPNCGWRRSKHLAHDVGSLHRVPLPRLHRMLEGKRCRGRGGTRRSSTRSRPAV